MQEMRLNEGGDLMIPGTLTTGGPSCGGGCNYVFQPGYDLESIDEHAAYMWETSHLRGVGSTAPGKPMKLSEKMGGLINELEKAHIYIERLHGRVKTVQAEASRKDVLIAGLEQRLARLESVLPADLAGN